MPFRGCIDLFSCFLNSRKPGYQYVSRRQFACQLCASGRMDFPRFCSVVVKQDYIRRSSVNESHQDSALVVRAGAPPCSRLYSTGTGGKNCRVFSRKLLEKGGLFLVLPEESNLQTLGYQSYQHT